MTNGMTRRTAAVLVMLMMIAVPATAAVITQNFMQADVSLEAACFIKTAGADALGGSGFVSFDGGATVDAGGGVTLLQETTELQGFKGDRIIYSDAVHFENRCGHTIQVSLVSQNGPDGRAALEPPAVAGSVWEDLNIKLYLSDVPIADDPGIPADGNTDWELMLTVDDGGRVTPGGAITIPNGGIHRLAFVIDTQFDVALPTDTAILRWTAQAVHP